MDLCPPHEWQPRQDWCSPGRFSHRAEHTEMLSYKWVLERNLQRDSSVKIVTARMWLPLLGRHSVSLEWWQWRLWCEVARYATFHPGGGWCWCQAHGEEFHVQRNHKSANVVGRVTDSDSSQDQLFDCGMLSLWNCIQVNHPFQKWCKLKLNSLVVLMFYTFICLFVVVLCPSTI